MRGAVPSARTHLPVAEEEVCELALVDLDAILPVLRSGVRLRQPARRHGRVREHHRGHVGVVRLIEQNVPRRGGAP